MSHHLSSSFLTIVCSYLNSYPNLRQCSSYKNMIMSSLNYHDSPMDRETVKHNVLVSCKAFDRWHCFLVVPREQFFTHNGKYITVTLQSYTQEKFIDEDTYLSFVNRNCIYSNQKPVPRIVQTKNLETPTKWKVTTKSKLKFFLIVEAKQFH